MNLVDIYKINLLFGDLSLKIIILLVCSLRVVICAFA